jgi:hypothetical protein
MRYSYLEMLLDGYHDLDPRSIQKSVKRVLMSKKFTPDYSIKNHAYSFAKAFYERTTGSIFLSLGRL